MNQISFPHFSTDSESCVSASSATPTTLEHFVEGVIPSDGTSESETQGTYDDEAINFECLSDERHIFM
jgi:hypothetical protein